MPKRLVLENEFVRMWLYPRAGIIHHEIRKYVWGSAFRELLNEGLAILKREHATKWLSDDRKNGALAKEDTDWAVNDWFPRVTAAGWKDWALVLPESVLGQMNMQRFVAAYASRGVNARTFSAPALALSWLEAAPRRGGLPDATGDPIAMCPASERR